MKNPIPPPPEADPDIGKSRDHEQRLHMGHPDLFGEFTGMRLYSEGHY
ncbi:MAG TPA: hypothetical protein VJ833_07515 [Rhodanobacteraceae bacterium]|nr:hypothetical protein [Rhodanobacteraceae bacterium]